MLRPSPYYFGFKQGNDLCFKITDNFEELQGAGVCMSRNETTRRVKVGVEMMEV